ncbi:hypothetical protein ACFL5M_04110 [Candidatus Neomarinimicrobiota bacterium]
MKQPMYSVYRRADFVIWQYVSVSSQLALTVRNCTIAFYSSGSGCRTTYDATVDLQMPSRLTHGLKEQTMPIPPRWYGKGEAAAYLGCSVDFLLVLVENGEITYSRGTASNPNGELSFYEGWLDNYKKREAKNPTYRR